MEDEICRKVTGCDFMIVPFFLTSWLQRSGKNLWPVNDICDSEKKTPLLRFELVLVFWSSWRGGGVWEVVFIQTVL